MLGLHSLQIDPMYLGIVEKKQASKIKLHERNFRTKIRSIGYMLGSLKNEQFVLAQVLIKLGMQAHEYVEFRINNLYAEVSIIGWGKLSCTQFQYETFLKFNGERFNNVATIKRSFPKQGKSLTLDTSATVVFFFRGEYKSRCIQTKYGQKRIKEGVILQ